MTNLGENEVVRVIPIHGNGARETDGRYAGKGSQLVENVLLHADYPLGLRIGNLRVRNVETECLHYIWSDEPWGRVHQGAESANHQPGTDQQHER